MAYSSAAIATILIPDSNIFALLPRCSKVLLGPHVILADGALLSIAGSLPLCLAANRMRVPVVAVGGMFKFSPIYLGEAADWGMRDLGSPEEVLPSTEECVRASSLVMPPHVGSEDDEDEEAYAAEEQDETEILNPYYDVVPADLVSLYISNLCVALSLCRQNLFVYSVLTLCATISAVADTLPRSCTGCSTTCTGRRSLLSFLVVSLAIEQQLFRLSKLSCNPSI